MIAYNDIIINYRERKEESYYKVKSEKNVIIVKDSKRKIGNIDYISEKVRLCPAPPPVANNNRTPPPILSPHFTTINFHLILLLIKYCVASLDSCSLN